MIHIFGVFDIQKKLAEVLVFLYHFTHHRTLYSTSSTGQFFSDFGFGFGFVWLGTSVGDEACL